MPRQIWYLILIILFNAAPASGATITVDQDGGGDYLSITAALAAANPAGGDVIEIEPGTYVEAIVVDRSVEFVGVGSPDLVVLDGEGSLGVMTVLGAYTVGFRSMTFTRSYVVDAGGAIDMRFDPVVTIEDCRFVQNYAAYDGGAIHARHAGTRVEVLNSYFEGNYAVHNAGAGAVLIDAYMRFEGCEFRNNSAGVLGGAVASDSGAHLVVEDCLFAWNTGSPGAILVRSSTGEIRQSTFHGNVGSRGSIDCVQSAATVERNIITGNTQGYGLLIEYNPIFHGCNLYFDNLHGAVGGGALAPSDVVADPMYCDLPGSDFTVAMSSPANPAYSPCGQPIGAFPAVCALPIEGVPTSFSQIKTRF